MRVLNLNKIELKDMEINLTEFTNLLLLIQNKKITDKIGIEILEKLILKKFDVNKYVKDNKLESIQDINEIEAFCNDVIKQNKKAVDDFKSGKEMAINAIIGTVMRRTKGKASPRDVKDILKKLLN